MSADPATRKSDTLRYWCFRCRRPLVNDNSRPDRNPEDTCTANRRTHELRHDGCGGMVSMSRREAQSR